MVLSPEISSSAFNLTQSDEVCSQKDVIKRD